MRIVRLLFGLVLLASASLVLGGWIKPIEPASESVSRFHLIHRIEGADPLRILWFGNSHTYVWNVPRLVVELARASGQGPLEVEAITEGGASLPMAMALPAGIEALRSPDRDVVLLQEGSYITSFQPDQQRRNVDEALRAFSKRPRVILYQNWTYAGDEVPERLKMFAAQAGQPKWVLDRFEQAFDVPAAARQAEIDRQFAVLSQDLDVETAFAGRAIWRGQEAGLPLISHDGNHLDQLGAVVAAIVIYRQVFGSIPEKPGAWQMAVPWIDLVALTDVGSSLERETRWKKVPVE